jgi:hypothetical protein
MARRSDRPADPIRTLTIAVLAYLACAGFAVATVVEHGETAQSSYVQAHGVRDTATVVSVHNIEPTGKHRAPPSAEVTVRLRQPVNGTVTSVVHVPDHDSSAPGDTIAVVVDPRQPGYSELPGEPGTTAWKWIGSLCISVFLLACAVFQTRKAVRLSRQRRVAGGFA